MSKQISSQHQYNTSQSKQDNATPFRLGFLEFLSDGVVVLDQKHQIVAVNSAVSRILGWSNFELIGRHWQELLGNQQTNPSTAAWPFFSDNSADSQLISKAVTPHELTLNCKETGSREISASFSPLHLDASTSLLDTDTNNAAPKSLYNLVILRDISEQKRLEQIKSQFVLTASHQLRTPLASIKNSIGLVLDNLPANLAEPLLRLLQNIQSSSLRMERLVNDLIELANLQSGLVQLQSQRLEVSHLVKRAVSANEQKLQQKAQPLELILPPKPLFVSGDRARLTQILGHLLSNASKFSQSGSPIQLKVTVTGQSGSAKVLFSVTDRGRGISLQEQQLIFEKFYQSDVSENADGSGSGLGLPLAKALVELHGGRLWLESTPREGSSFYFELPLLEVTEVDVTELS